jgi:hypothetical protein
MRGSRVLLGAALGLLVIAIAATGARQSQHVLRSNLEPPAAFTAVVPGGARLCQDGERIPSGAGAVRLRIGTFGPPGPRLSVALRTPDGRLSTGGLDAGWRQGDIAVPIAKVRGDHDRSVTCLTNEGSRKIALAGTVRDPSRTATIEGTHSTTRVWIEYLEPGRRSDWALASAVAHRAGDVRDALPGSLTVPAWCLLALVTVGGSVGLLIRGLRA